MSTKPFVTVFGMVLTFQPRSEFSSKIKGTDNLQSLVQRSIPIPWREICAWLKLKLKCIALYHQWLERTNACLSGKHSVSASPWCHSPGKKCVRLTSDNYDRFLKLQENSCSCIQFVNSIADRFLGYSSNWSISSNRSEPRHCPHPPLA
jgi:hypothetical protein